jgi:excisionase family DNA binding protein
MTEIKQDRLIRISETADLLGVHPETLRRWDREGKFHTVVINERGDRRFKLSEINKFIDKKK